MSIISEAGLRIKVKISFYTLEKKKIINEDRDKDERLRNS